MQLLLKPNAADEVAEVVIRMRFCTPPCLKRLYPGSSASTMCFRAVRLQALGHGALPVADGVIDVRGKQQLLHMQQRGELMRLGKVRTLHASRAGRLPRQAESSWWKPWQGLQFERGCDI